MKNFTSHITMMVIAQGFKSCAAISEELENRNVSISRAAIYMQLRKLRENGYIKAKLGKPTPERGGKAKLYYEITAKGKTELNNAAMMFDSFRKAA